MWKFVREGGNRLFLGCGTVEQSRAVEGCEPGMWFLAKMIFWKTPLFSPPIACFETLIGEKIVWH